MKETNKEQHSGFPHQLQDLWLEFLDLMGEAFTPNAEHAQKWKKFLENKGVKDYWYHEQLNPHADSKNFTWDKPYTMVVEFWREKYRGSGTIRKKVSFTFKNESEEMIFWRGFDLGNQEWDSFSDIKSSKVYKDGSKYDSRRNDEK